MDDKLHILQHLYGEVEDPEALRRLLEDDEVRAEYEALRDLKARLDERPRPRPDAALVDGIVAAAAAPDAAGLPGRRVDRAPRPSRAARRFRLFGAVSTALALVLVVGIGIVQWRDGTPPAASMEEAAPSAAREAPAVGAAAPGREAEAEDEAPAFAASKALRQETARADAVAPPRPLEAQANQAAPAPLVDTDLAEQAESDEAEDVPGWDEGDELLRVHRRIELLEARSAELNWDESAVMSLDVLPDQNLDAVRGLDAAGQRRPPDNR